MENIHELDGALLQAIAAIERLLALPCCNVAELSKVRYQASRAVAARRQAMDRIVNAAMQEGGARGEVVQKLRGGSFEVRMIYTDHVSAWPTSKAVANWPEYIAASRKLSESIRRQISVERELLYPAVPSLPV